MRVRLGFAVSAFLEPDILVVDEVLAVGDAEFQKKAIGKMQDISNTSGRTVLFVSHNMASVQNLCSRVLLLRNGEVETIGGETEKVIDYYLSKFRNHLVTTNLSLRDDRKGSGKITFLDYYFENEKGDKIIILQTGMVCRMVINIKNNTEMSIENVRLSVGIDDSNANRLTILSNHLMNIEISLKSNETKSVKITLPNLTLQAGSFYFTLFMSVDEEVSDWIENGGSFHVEHGDFFKTGNTVMVNQGNFLMEHSYD